MSINKTLSYCFNPFDPSQKSIEELKTLGKGERFIVIFFTVIASIFTLGIGTIGSFRLLTHKLSIKEKEEKEKKIEQASQEALFLKKAESPSDEATKLSSPKEAPPEPALPKAVTDTPSTPSSVQESNAIKGPEKDSAEVAKPPKESFLTTEEFWQGADVFNPDDVVEEPYKYNGVSYDEEFDRKPMEKLTPAPKEVPATSDFTKFLRESLRAYAPLEHGELGTADETGDCFYHSMAQLLSIHKKEEITTKMVRQKISEHIKGIAEGSKEDLALRGTLGDLYEDYKRLVGYTLDELIEKFNSVLEERNELIRAQNQKRQEIRDLLDKRFEDTAEQDTTKIDAAIKELNLLKAKENSIDYSLPFWARIGVDDEIVAKAYHIRIRTIVIYHKNKKVTLGPIPIDTKSEEEGPILAIALHTDIDDRKGHFMPIIPKK